MQPHIADEPLRRIFLVAAFSGESLLMNAERPLSLADANWPSCPVADPAADGSTGKTGITTPRSGTLRAAGYNGS
jgi:hypothetical protein